VRARLLSGTERALRWRVRPPPRRLRRVLLLRPDHLGDVLLTSPAVDWLRRRLPDVELTYLVGPWSADVAGHGPRGVRLETLAFPGFGRAPNASLVAPYTLLARAAAQLRRADYDAAVVFRPDHWWGGLLALAAGIPIRLGFAVPGTDRFLTDRVPPAPSLPAAEQSLQLAERLLVLAGSRQPGGLSPSEGLAGVGPTAALPSPRPIFRLREDERQEAHLVWHRHALGDRRVVALQPTAGAQLKRWPAAWWARVADALAACGNAVVLAGGPGDAHALDAIAAHMAEPVAAILTGLPLGVSAGVYARCALLVGLDGGGAHLAAAVGTPTVRLYGPADVHVFGPWPREPSQLALTAPLGCVPCRALEHPPCGAWTEPACLLALTPERVARVSLEVLNASR
jgi:ADP-heptose:LPS heptosyltransferase